MKTVIMMVMSFFYSGLALAGEGWLCQDEASQRRSNSILACGVASDKDENASRAKAFENAKDEFSRVCSISSECKNHEFQVVPQRTQCSADSGGYKCYRLVVFYIGQRVVPEKRVKPVIAVGPPILAPQTVVARVAQVVHKIRKGMHKKELVAAFGTPSSIDVNPFDNTLSFIYSTSLCEYDVCVVKMDTHSRVVAYIKIKPQYMAELD